MKSAKTIYVLLTMLAILMLTACGNVENSSADISSSNNSNISYSNEENVTSSEPSSVASIRFQKDIDSSVGMSMAEFLVSEKGMDFQKVANKAAVAYLRNDKEKLSQYMADPNYETGLSEDGNNLISNLVYMVLKIPSDFDPLSANEGIYPATYEYVIEGTEMVMYLDLGLRLTDSGWKVEYIYLQG